MNKDQLVRAMNLTSLDRSSSAFDEVRATRPNVRPSGMPGIGQRAAIIALLFPDLSRELQLLLIRRHQGMTHHAGQIGFPGGRLDSGESPLAAALRELNEELGIDAKGIDILGSLSEVYIPPSDFTVRPFVGWLDFQPTLFPAEEEVAEVITVPLAVFLDRANVAVGPVETATGTRPVPYYEFEGHQIWGATALMIDELSARVVQVGCIQ